MQTQLSGSAQAPGGHVTFSLTWSLQEGAELYFLSGHWCTCLRPGTLG